MKTSQIQETLRGIIAVHLEKARLAPGTAAINHQIAAEKAIEMLNKLETPTLTPSAE